jgi:hypothetical protein
MFGCCFIAGKKFITKSGELDRERLKAAFDYAGEDFVNPTIDEAEGCTCACHRDGIACLC